MSLIGFIGLGIMGKPMSRHLLAVGHSLIVYDHNPEAIAGIVASGATAGKDKTDVARRCPIIITMLPDSPDVEDVLGGPAGVIAQAQPGALLIDMSTISPVVTRRLASAAEAKGLRILDAPVSGGEKGAIDATLSIMVGGKESVFNEALPLFRALGKTIVLVGDNGAGQVVKACNQIMVGLQLEAMAEALVLGAKAGVDPAKVIQVLSGGLAQSRVMDLRGPTILARNFKPGFRVRLHYKDLNIALATADEYGVSLPVTALVHEMFKTMKVLGREDYDHSGIITLLEDWAKIEVKG